MRSPLIPQFSRPQCSGPSGESRVNGERGITLLLVAVAMLAIIGMAALAIDVVTLYLAREEAQRAADAGAIAGARILSLTGVMGDPDNLPISNTTTMPWPQACLLAKQIAQDVAYQNGIQSLGVTPTVTFSYNGTATTDCNIGANQKFGMNPQVQVQVVRNGLPSLFSRIWSHATNTITASATAEAFDPAQMQVDGMADIIPVAPRCLKPWIIPNLYATGQMIVDPNDGTIKNAGIQTSAGPPGIIGQPFTLTDECAGQPNCTFLTKTSTAANFGSYVSALLSLNPAVAIPSCANSGSLEQAVGGCDVTTAYNCGTQLGATLDYTVDPGPGTTTAVNCLISSGDTMDYSGFPFQIKAGPSNPLFSVGQPITSSNSIVSLPIFDSGPSGSGNWPSTSNQPTVTIVGFLQLFIDGPSASGSVSGHIINVTGCGNGTVHPVGTAVNGSSPVPVRLITPP